MPADGLVVLDDFEDDWPGLLLFILCSVYRFYLLEQYQGAAMLNEPLLLSCQLPDLLLLTLTL